MFPSLRRLNMHQHQSSLGRLSLVLLGLHNVVTCSAQDLRAILTDASNEWDYATIVSFPESEEFINATLRWDAYAPPTYSAAISPGTEDDVAKAVCLEADTPKTMS